MLTEDLGHFVNALSLVPDEIFKERGNREKHRHISEKTLDIL